MNKTLIVSLLALMTAISGVTYYTLKDSTTAMKAGQDPNNSEVYQQWLAWLNNYGKQYQHEEIPLKFATFSTNYKYIKSKNSEKKNFQLGLNQFADLTNQEFSALNQGQLIFKDRPRNEKTLTGSVPASINWNTKGAVTPIKNQGQCGSCWAFSTTGSLEGLNFITNGQLLSFSEQQLVDCSASYGNQGCNGGLMDDAFQYVEKYGIELESTYPYTGQTGTCQYNAADVKFKNTGYTDVVQNNSMQLQSAVAQQPVSIAIEADSMNFQFYTSGVFDDASCGTNLDHGVLNVGYGTSSGQAYWIVKNSWGASWGNNGFIWIAYTANTDATPGLCGINMSASYPTA